MSKAKEHIDSKANFPPLGGSNRDRQTRKTSLREANFATAEGCDEAISQTNKEIATVVPPLSADRQARSDGKR